MIKNIHNIHNRNLILVKSENTGIRPWKIWPFTTPHYNTMKITVTRFYIH